MAIEDVIQSMNEKLGEAYDAVEERGGALPEQKNMANLAETIGKTFAQDIEGKVKLYGDYGSFVYHYYNTDPVTVQITSLLDYLQLAYKASDDDWGGGGDRSLIIDGKSYSTYYVEEYTWGTDCAIVPDYFLCGLDGLKRVNGHPSAKIIGSNFMDVGQYGYGQFNAPIDLTGVEQIGDRFMYGQSQFNSELIMPDVKSIGSYFMYNCSRFDQELPSFTELTEIKDYVLYGCSALNHPVTFSSKLTKIGRYFLYSAAEFDQPIVIPASVESVGDNFMGYRRKRDNTITVETTVSPTDNYSLSAYSNSVDAYTQGVKITGAGASNWKANLPDRTSSPYRKLIIGA